MRHLHRSGVIHRDLAIRNVLLNGSSPPTCKISDFGLSRQWDSERSMTDSTSGLPIRWMSPESAPLSLPMPYLSLIYI
jgi:serine/threonine protein kinase